MGVAHVIARADESVAEASRAEDAADRDARSVRVLAYASTAPEPVRRRLQQRVVIDYLDVARAVARRYQGSAQDRADLQQVAFIGLTHAVQRFEPDQGTSIVPFAVPTIVGEIKHYLRDATWFVRPPRKLQEIHSEVRQVAPMLAQSLGREPSAAELATAIGRASEDVEEALRSSYGRQPSSLDGPPSRSGTHPDPHGTASQRDELGRAELRLAVQQACMALSQRERRIVFLRFYCDWTQTEIAHDLGVTQMQVSRLLQRIFTALRERLSPDLLQD